MASMSPVWILAFVGALFALSGSVQMWRSRGDLAKRRLLLSTPTSRIAEADGGIVEVAGRVVANDGGTFVSPFSNQIAVYLNLIVEEYQQHGKTGRWETIFRDTRQQIFYIDDGSGQLARVDPQGARFVLDRTLIASSGLLREPPHALGRFLAERGVNRATRMGFNRQLRFQEELLRPNDPVYALGPTNREAGPPNQEGYRTEPTTQLAFFSVGAGDGELLLSDKSERALASRLLRPLMVGALIAAVGVILCIMALVKG